MSDDPEEFCPTCFAGMESSEHHEKCVRPLYLLDDIVAGLFDVYEPAGALIFWSSRITYLDGRRPCDIWSERDLPMLERLAQRVNALADGAFA